MYLAMSCCTAKLYSPIPTRADDFAVTVDLHTQSPVEWNGFPGNKRCSQELHRLGYLISLELNFYNIESCLPTAFLSAFASFVNSKLHASQIFWFGIGLWTSRDDFGGWEEHVPMPDRTWWIDWCRKRRLCNYWKRRISISLSHNVHSWQRFKTFCRKWRPDTAPWFVPSTCRWHRALQFLLKDVRLEQVWRRLREGLLEWWEGSRSSSCRTRSSCAQIRLLWKGELTWSCASTRT